MESCCTSATAIPISGTGWLSGILTSPPARRTNTKASNCVTRRSSFRTATRWCGLIRAAPDAPRVISIRSVRARNQDIYDCIEWTAAQPWCSGKVGMSGISYLASNQWQVAALQPPASRRDLRLGGHERLLPRMGASRRHPKHVRDGAGTSRSSCRLQHGKGANGYKSRMNGEWAAGPETLSEQELAANRIDWHDESPQAQACDRCVLDLAYTRSLEESRCRFSPAPTGAVRASSARQCRGLSASWFDAQMARIPLSRTLDRVLHRLWRQPAKEVLRSFSEGREHRLERRSRRC